MNWFYAILSATFIYGVINFLYKIGAAKKYPSASIVNIQAATVALLSLGAVIASKSQFADLKLLLILAVLNSFFWSAGTVLKISALKKIPVNVAMPINKLNSIFVIIIGLIFSETGPLCASRPEFCLR